MMTRVDDEMSHLFVVVYPLADIPRQVTLHSLNRVKSSAITVLAPAGFDALTASNNSSPFALVLATDGGSGARPVADSRAPRR